MTSRARSPMRNSHASAPDTSDAPDTPDAVGEIEVQVAVLVRNLELLRRRGDFGSDLDRAGYLLLRALDALGPSDINTLAAALGLDPSTAGRQVSMMEQDALVERTPGPDDRRRSVVTASAAGRRRMAETSARRRDSTAALLADWDEPDLRSLADMFTRFNDAVAHRYLTGVERLATAPPEGTHT